MQRHLVDGLYFNFPNDWHVSKYDDWSFYRTKFSRMWNGIKSLDLLAISPAKTAWLIEVKDYRLYQRTKPSELSEEIGKKVFDTLAALLPAKVNADDAEEIAISKRILDANKLRVVLHLEQPAKHSKLRPRAINPADIQMKLRQILKPIDARPILSEMASMGSLQWSVTSN
jgi:hypothetical protein